MIYDDGVEVSRTRVYVSETPATNMEFEIDPTLVFGDACIWLVNIQGGAKLGVAQDTSMTAAYSFGTGCESAPAGSSAACPSPSWIPSWLIDWELVMWAVADTADLIVGTVVDSLNAGPIAHCEVSAIDEATGRAAGSDTTDAEGRYRLPLFESRPYRLFFTHEGYFPDSLVNVEITAGADIDSVALSTKTVLLVHGAFRDGGTWTDELNFPAALTAAGFHVPTPVSLVLGGIDGWTGQGAKVERQADRLVAAMDDLDASEGIKSVYIVGHSMGGLVARQVARSDPDRITSIVMLGTPNHGTELANAGSQFIEYAIRVLCHLFPRDCDELIAVQLPPVAQDLRVGSELLRSLNYDGGVAYDNSECRTHPNETTLDAGVEYFTYRGSAYTDPTPRSEFCGSELEWWMAWPLATISGCGVNDFVVPVSSVPLMAQSTPGNVHNFEDGDVGCSSSHRLETCTDMLADPCVANFVVDALSGNLQASGSPEAPESPLVGPSGSLILDDGFLGYPNDAELYEAAVGTADSVLFGAVFLAGDGDFTLIDPLGRPVNPDTAAVDPNIDYEDLNELRLYHVRSPLAGNWTVSVDVSGPDTSMTFLSGLEYSGLSLRLRTSASEILPMQAQIVEAALAFDGAPLLDATMSGGVTDPASGTSTFSLVDDGTGPDATADDGIYTGEISDNELLGQYEVLVAAVGTLPGGGTLNRKAKDLYFVAVRPDAQVTPDDLALFPSDSLVTIEATIRNVGTATADTVLVRFLDGTTGLAFAETLSVGLAAGTSVTMEREWPVPAGLEEISLGVRVFVFGDTVETNTLNNEAWATSPVVGVDEAPTGELTSVQALPSQRPYAHPNPLRSRTKLVYVTDRGPVNVRIYDVAGRQVRLLHSAQVEERGRYEIVWDARDDRGHELPAGVYFYRVAKPERGVTGRLVLVR